jgi:hypothetical protein
MITKENGFFFADEQDRSMIIAEYPHVDSCSEVAKSTIIRKTSFEVFH